MENNKTKAKKVPYIFKTPFASENKEDVILCGITPILYNELENIGTIERMKRVPQLGIIKNRDGDIKYRWDYICMQIWLHNFIQINRKEMKLPYSYNSKLYPKDFNGLIRDEEVLGYWSINENSFSVASLLHTLVIIYNIGHFKSTFAGSRACILAAQKDSEFRNKLETSVPDPRFKRFCQSCIDKNDYLHFHLLNSLIVLSHCDQSLEPVRFATELLYAYLEEDWNQYTDKTRFLFRCFQIVRNISFIAYDFPSSDLPFRLDVFNRPGLVFLFTELLDKYNNHSYSENLISSINKLLNDCVYNESFQMILNCQVAKSQSNSIISEFKKIGDSYNYFSQLDNCDSNLNIANVRSQILI